MAAAVVYEGHVGGGTLFQGMKFFIIQRVPLRQQWVDLVNANGGEIVKLEKQADMIIVDPARKASIVPGSFSWKFIQDSAKNGKLEDPENYLAGPPAGTARPVGALSATRSTRTPFTAADDKVLAEFVTLAERRGQSVKGNLIYQELERLNPRHTSQSWRDRWVKYHQDKPRPDIKAEVFESLQKVAVPRHEPSSSPVPRTAKPVPVEKETRSTATSKNAPPAKQSPFTDTDSKALLDIYDDIINLDETKADDAWEAWADNNPKHTAQQWQGFWENVIRPLGAPEPIVRERDADDERSVKKARLEEGDADLFKSSLSHVDIKHVASLPSQSETERTFSPRSPLVGHGYKMHSSPTRRFVDGDSRANPHSSVEEDFEESPIFRTPTMGSNFAENPPTDPFLDNNLDDQRNIRSPLAEHNFNKILTNPLEGSNSSEDEELQIAVKVCEMAPETLEQKAYRRRATKKDTLIRVPIGTDIGAMTPDQQACVVFVPHGSSGTAASNVDLRQLHRLQHLEVRFNERITGFSHQQGYEVTLHPTLFARSIRLMTLYQVVRLLGGTDEVERENKWPQVCEILGFSVARLPEAPGVVRTLYDEQLADFADARDNWRAAVLASLRPEEELTQVELDDFVGLDMQPAPRNEIPDTPEASDSYKTAESGGMGMDEEEDADPPVEDSQEESNVAELRAYVDYHISLGYDEKVVKAALSITTMNTENCILVMEALTQTGEIPEDVPGVWTEADDQAIRNLDDVEGNKQVLMKHGMERYQERRQFLSDADAFV